MSLRVPTPTRTEERIRQLATFDANGQAVIRLPRRRVGQPCIVSRLLAAVPVAAEALLQDSFTRVVANGWGTPDVGPAYGIFNGAAADFSVTGTEGMISNAIADHTISSPLNLANVNAQARIATGPAVAGAGSHRLIVRSIDANNYYYIDVTYPGFAVNYNGSSLGRRVAGVDTLLAAGPNPAAAVVFVRLVANGTTITASLWTAAEGAPFATVTDLALTGAGGVGAAKMTAGEELHMDNLLVTSPAGAPIWDAYINDPAQLINLIDSSVVAVDRWIPQITNGQRLNPGEELIIAPRAGQVGAQAIVTCSFVYST